MTDDEDQLALVKAKARAVRAKPRPSYAETDPIARVVLTVSLPHLDRPYDYLVPASMAETAVPGARISARFGGQDVDGFVLERRSDSNHAGSLQALRRVVSAVPVLTPQLHALATQVAAEHAGGLPDVLRLAIPPRHAATEKAVLESPTAPWPHVSVDPGDWTTYHGGPAFLRRVSAGEGVRAAWCALPGSADQSWPVLLARAGLAAVAGGRSAVIVVPDGADVDRVTQALWDVAPSVPVARYTHDVGAGPRYEAFLRALTGRVAVIVGTRSAAFLPVPDLGLLICWEDGDESHSEPRAPYPHTRDVIRVRAQQTGCAVLFAGHARSVEVQQLVETGWARELSADRSVVRRRAARVVVAGADTDAERDAGARTRLPSAALQLARATLKSGAPVLVQVPRVGYQLSLSCQHCRHQASCAHCHGPLLRTGPSQPPSCRWCGRAALTWSCPNCGDTRLRTGTVGTTRTAEELGRALPGTPVLTSSGDRVLRTVPDRPALVLATPGAEPVADAGYGAALLMDTWLTLARPTLDADEQALRRWLAAVDLIRSDGQVLVIGEAGHRAIQALVRHDPVNFAHTVRAERISLGLPPATIFTEVVGDTLTLDRFLGPLTPDTTVLGPVPLPDQEDGQTLLGPSRSRVLLQTPADQAGDLVPQLRAIQVRLGIDRGTLPRVQVGAQPGDI